MAEVLNTAGKNQANPEVIVINKGFESLLISTTALFSELGNAAIQITLQRSTGRNVELTNGAMKLREFIRLCSAGNDAVSHDENGCLSVLCDLTLGGNIPLVSNDQVRVKFTNLASTKDFYVDTVEAPFNALISNVRQFEQKIMSANDKTITYDCVGVDAVLLDNSEDVIDVRITWANRAQTTHSLRELRGIVRKAIPFQYIDDSGVVSTSFSDKIQFPLNGVNAIEVNKITGAGTEYNVFLLSTI